MDEKESKTLQEEKLHCSFVKNVEKSMPEKVKYLSEIATEYGVHPHTMRNWLKPIWAKLKIQGRHSLLGWQVKMIYEFLDAPDCTLINPMK